MKFIIYLFAFLSSLFSLLVIFVILTLNIYGDQLLKESLQIEIENQLGAQARIEDARLSLIKPGVEIDGFYAPIKYPPLKLKFEKFRIAFNFRFLNLFDDNEKVLDLDLLLEKPKFSFGMDSNEDNQSKEIEPKEEL